MSTDALMTLRHSTAFVDRFRAVLVETYRWREDAGGVRVRDWRGREVVSVLPHMGYTDLDLDGARALADRLCGRRHLIRVLDVPDAPLVLGQPATMRVPLDVASEEELGARLRANRGLRKDLNRAERLGLEVASGTDAALLTQFLAGLARSLHRLGAPMLPGRLLRGLLDGLDGELLIVRSEGRAVAGLVLLHDAMFSWVAWSFSRADDPLRGVGSRLAYARAALHAHRRGSGFLDLGRSPVGSGVHDFKAQFGAVPVPITLLRHGVADPYAFAGAPQTAWRALPAPVADRLGPGLCRFLPEY